MATRRGLEPLTSAVTGRRSNQLNYRAAVVTPVMTSSMKTGGWYRDRTCDPRLVRAMLSQLS